MTVYPNARAAVLALPRRADASRADVWGPVVAMVLVTALGAQAVVRLPFGPVPFTMQVFGVMLTGLLLDPRRALAAQFAYVGLGAVGVPWFAGMLALGTGSLTVGYLAGFLIAAPLVASLRDRLGPVVAGLLGIAVIHALGGLHLARFPGIGPGIAVMVGVLPFLPGDLLKLGLAIATARRLAA